MIGQDPPMPLVPRLVVADPRKFSEYVLDPDRAKGKDHIFITRLGYRARNDEDARALSARYAAQAQASCEVGDYRLGKRDHHGQRYTIAIDLGGMVALSGWLLRADGVLWLVTPFAGFAADAGQGG